MGVSFGTFLRRRYDVAIRLRGDVPLGRLGDVPFGTYLRRLNAGWLQTPSNLILLTVLANMTSLTELQPKIRAPKLQKSTKFCLT